MSDWKELYQQKLVSVKEAAAKIESSDRCWISPCSGTPIELIEAITERANEFDNLFLCTGLFLYPFDFLTSSDYIGKINYYTIFYGPFERMFYDSGNINVNSITFSHGIEALRNEKKIGINTLLADVSVPDEEGYMYFGPMGVCEDGEIADFAKKIIVQVNKNQPKVSGEKHRIHVSEVTCICECDHPLPEFPQPEITETDQKIASLLIPNIPDGACIQLGVGGLANAIGYGLKDKKNLSVHTEMFTDSMVYLARHGAISGKIDASFALGNQDLIDFVGEGTVHLLPMSYVSNPYVIGQIDNFISINACLMADLTGQVCSESIGHYIYSSTGGQLDFVRGAAMSKGGQSYMCMPSTVMKKDGTLASTITLNLPEGAIVTTPRTDTMYIATEYGIADLHDQPIRIRIKRMIAIAHPDFREELTRQAIDAGLLREIDAQDMNA